MSFIGEEELPVLWESIRIYGLLLEQVALIS